MLETLQQLQRRANVLQQGGALVSEAGHLDEVPAGVEMGNLSSDILMLVSDQTEIPA